MPKRKEYNLPGPEYLERLKQGEKFRTATLHETMGPNYKDLYWLIDNRGQRLRPLVKL